MIRAESYAIGNADITIAAERPKIAPHASKCASIADALGVDQTKSASRRQLLKGLGLSGAGKALRHGSGVAGMTLFDGQAASLPQEMNYAYAPLNITGKYRCRCDDFIVVEQVSLPHTRANMIIS